MHLGVIAFGTGIITRFLIIGFVSGSIPNKPLIEYSTLVQKVSGVLLIAFGVCVLMAI